VKFIYEQATKKTIKTYQLHSPDIVVGENTQQRQWWFYSTAIPTRAKALYSGTRSQRSFILASFLHQTYYFLNTTYLRH
jgi:hypothetical protein